jgi:hypothetical protein
MRRTLWNVLFALLFGVALGLGYAWVISPHPMTDAQPSALRADFKDQYRAVIAAAYAATNNLPRAQARLSVLGDENPIDALNAQAQRMLASAQTYERAEHIVALASVLDQEAGNVITSGMTTNGAPTSTHTQEIPFGAGETLTPQSASLLTEFPALLSETPEFVETFPPTLEATPRPTLTPTLVPGEPFTLAGQETVCDSKLPGGLLQVLVLNRSRRQLAGTEIVITWDGGKEQFFTGLKPELGNGYADYIMTPDVTYTVQLGRGSDVALGITAPTCQSPDGATFLGSVKLTFQQP